MFAAPSPPDPPLNRPLEPLTRNQLLQAFDYLLKSDPDFINKLHEAYVKSFGEILS
jgi:mRNA-decapping enzyme 1B